MAIVPETAALEPCELILNPTDPKYTDVTIRQFQGCPTIAATRGGRLYVGWYSGGVREPHIDNFNLLVYSDDQGKSWSEPLLVIPSSRERLVHALDIQLWLSPDGRLYVYWVQNNVKPAIKNPDGSYVYPGYESDGYIFNDFTHAEWCVVCDDPDAENPVFGEPRYVDRGFLRCKPLVTSSGRILNFNYDQTSEYYGYSYSDDGVNFTHAYGGKKLPTPFDESMAYERRDGSIRMLARTSVGYAAESTSYDNGISWTDGALTDIPNANTRLYISRTPSGRVLMVGNDSSRSRCRMTVYLSDDDGKSWQYQRCIDEREALSYPDADFHDGRIFLSTTASAAERAARGRYCLRASPRRISSRAARLKSRSSASRNRSEAGVKSSVARVRGEIPKRRGYAGNGCVCTVNFRGGADVWAVVQVRI